MDTNHISLKYDLNIVYSNCDVRNTQLGSIKKHTYCNYYYRCGTGE